MGLQKIHKISIILFCFILIVSCKEKQLKQNKIIENKKGRDTLTRGRVYKGVYLYTSDVDSTKVLEKNIISHDMFLFASSVEKNYERIEDMDSVKHKIYRFKDNKVYFNFRFEDAGDKTVHFMIRDIFYYKDSISNDSILVRTILSSKNFFHIKDSVEINVEEPIHFGVKRPVVGGVLD